MKTVFLPLACVFVVWMLAGPSALRAGETFLGPIPVQYVNPGEELVLDMHRFYQPEGEPALQLVKSDKCTARFDQAAFTLHIQPKQTQPGLFPVTFWVPKGDGGTYGEVTVVVRPQAWHRFQFQPAGAAATVGVVGDFNGWNPGSTPIKKDENGTYTADVLLGGGKHAYDFVVDGRWLTDPAVPETARDETHGEHSVLDFTPEDSFHAPSLYVDFQDEGLLGVRIVDGAVPVKEVSALLENEQGVEGLDRQIIKGVIHLALPKGATGFVRVLAEDEQGNVSNVVRVPVGKGQAFRWQDAVMYYALTDRFADGDTSNDRPVENMDVSWPANYHGGDLRGIRQKIEEVYFDKLGVNTVWIAPLNRNPDRAFRESPEPHRWYTGYHGYWPVSPTEIDPHFGNPEELKALVNAAHAHGIKVIADLVLHHVHEDHPWWKLHPDWFGSLLLPDGRQNLRLWDEQQFTTWFEPFLPSFDFSKDEPTQALIDNTVWWAEEYDLDGFRLDAVKHILPRFWYRFRAALRERVDAKRGRPLYLVGETFKDREGIDQFVGPNMLDGQFDFPLYDTLKGVFAQDKGDLRTLEHARSESERIYGKEALMSPLVGNHDKARFLAYADGDVPADVDATRESAIGWDHPPTVDHPDSYKKLELAQAYLMTLDGVPMLYYGDEAGMTGAGDPDNRRDMVFGDKVTAEGEAVLANFQKLGRLRASHPALRYGSHRPILEEAEVAAFVRAYLGDRVLAIFNRGKSAREVSLQVSPELADGDYTEALSGVPLKIRHGVLACTVPAQSVFFLTTKPQS